MNIIKGNSPELENSLIELLIKDYKRNDVYDLLVPAGGTPTQFYKTLRERHAKDFENFNFWQIDDVLNGDQKDCFYHFFEENLGNLNSQLKGIKDSFLGFHRKYSSFLGLGVNGHVAFHEPHIPLNFSYGCVELGNETLEYLNLEPKTWGITYGLGTFLKSHAVFLMVKGEHKKEILKRFLSEDKTVPASALRSHKNLYLLVDESLADLL